MIYGCIGEQLPHSFSREIHEAIGGYAYELREIAPDRLDAFMAERSFRAVNVKKRAAVAFGETVGPGLFEDSRVYAEETQAVGNGRLREIEPRRQIFLGQPRATDQKRIQLGRFDKVTRGVAEL